jgi:hypothetical protein
MGGPAWCRYFGARWNSQNRRLQLSLLLAKTASKAAKDAPLLSYLVQALSLRQTVASRLLIPEVR